MQSLIKEIREKLSNCTNDKVRDACLLASIQAINHYKISQYGTAAAFAKAIGSLHYADVFHEAELKEVSIDARLTSIAEKEINREAMAPLSLSAS
jgi:ferritin-like metal-binding protein YciE